MAQPSLDPFVRPTTHGRRPPKRRLHGAKDSAIFRKGAVEYASRFLGVTPGRITQLVDAGAIVLDEHGRPSAESLRAYLVRSRKFTGQLFSALDAALFRQFRDGLDPVEVVIAAEERGESLSAEVVQTAWTRYVELVSDPKVVELRERRAAKEAEEREAATRATCSACGRSARRRAGDAEVAGPNAPTCGTCKAPIPQTETKP